MASVHNSVLEHLEQTSHSRGQDSNAVGLPASRQRPVLPEGGNSGLWCFTIPWSPFEAHLKSLAKGTKPFVWTQPFRVGSAELMLFAGLERMEAEDGRLSLWFGICNNLSQPLALYSKTEIWMPGSLDGSPCGECFLVGDAVDALAPCGQSDQQKFGRFWWHVGPGQVEPHLYRAPFDQEGERSFDVMISVKVLSGEVRTKSPAREDDPQLWEIARHIISPWVQSVTTAKVTAVTTPLLSRISALANESEGLRREKLEAIQRAAEKEERRVQELQASHRGQVDDLTHRLQQAEHQRSLEEQRRVQTEQLMVQQQQEAQRREAAIEQKLKDALQREEQLRKINAQQQQQVEAAVQREAQARALSQQLEARLQDAAKREEALRARGQEMEQMLVQSAEREKGFRDQIQQLRDYIQGVQQREEKFRADIANLEGRLRGATGDQEQLRRHISVLQHEVQALKQNEVVLRESNTRLLAATVDEHNRVQAINNSPQRQRMVR